MNKNKLILLVFALLYGCDHSSSIQVKKIVPSGEVSTKTAEASQAEKNRAEIRALMRKAHAGDGEAAYELTVKYSIGTLYNPIIAYFWANEARKLHNPKMTDDLLKSFEAAIWRGSLESGDRPGVVDLPLPEVEK